MRQSSKECSLWSFQIPEGAIVHLFWRHHSFEAFNRVTPAGFIETAGQTLLLRTDASLAELDRLAEEKQAALG